MYRRLGVLLVIAASLSISGGAAATSDSTLNFENDFYDGVALTNEYADLGIVFGNAADYGVNLTNGNCGSPTQYPSNFGHAPNSTPRAARTQVCGIEFSYAGTFIHFSWPRKKVDVWVGNTLNVQSTIQMIAYNSSGQAIGSTQSLTGQGANWNLAINHATADIAGVAIQGTSPTTTDNGINIDDLLVDNSASAITPSGATITTNANQAFNGVVGHFSDQDPTAAAGDFTATIDWGDGQTSAGTVVSTGNQNFDVSGSHTWTAAGQFPVTVTLNKAAYGRSTQIVSSAQVNDPNATPTPTPTATATDTATPTYGTATPTPPPTTTPTPAPGGGTHVQASFTTPAPSIAQGKLLVLDASSSVSAGGIVQQYLWDVNSDGKTDASCDGVTPVLETKLPSSGDAPVKLTAVASGGQTSSIVKPLTVTSSRPRTASVVKLPYGLSYSCKPATPSTEDVTAQGGPPAGCVASVHFGIIDAVGCLTPAPRAEDLPAAERNIISGIFGDVQSRASAAAIRTPAGKFDKTDSAFSTRDPAYSTQPVRVNGLDIIPAQGAVVAIVPSDYNPRTRAETTGWIVSSNATIRVGSVPVKSGQIRVKVPYAAQTAHVFDFDLKRDVPFLKDLPLTGGMEGDLVDQATLLPAHVMLPGVFTDPSTGKGLSAEVTLRTTNRDGILLDGLEVRAPHVFLGGVALDDLYFKYARADESYEGGGGVVFPPSADKISGSIRFERGEFKHMDLAYDAGPGSQGIVIGPAVSIFHLGGAFSLKPTEIQADTVIGLGVAAGSGCPAVGVHANVNQHFYPGPYVLDAHGDVQLKCIPLSRGFLHIDGTGFVSFGGALDYNFKVFSLKAEFTATFQDPHFQIDADAKGCVGDFGCISGELVVSDIGMGFCADFGFTHAGAGFFYPPVDAFATPATTIAGILSRASIMFTSCNVGQYRTLPKAAPAQAGAARTFEVTDPGAPLIVGAVGGDGVPQVKLVGPDGRVIQAPAGSPVRTADEVVFHSPADNTEYFLVNHPAKGTWRLEPLEGSPAVADVKLASAQPDPKITGKVTHKGSAYSLAYRWTKAPGQAVTFVEHAAAGDRVIGTAKAANGTIRFTPSDAPDHARTIVARVTLDGHPQGNLDVAKFSASAPGLARPGGVRIKRHGKVARITWNKVANANGYLVSAVLSDGRHLVIPVRKGPHLAVVAGLKGRVKIAAHVSALKFDLRPGPVSKTVRTH